MSLSEQTRAYMQQQDWWTPDATYLLAVSGGLDSTVLTTICAELGLSIGLAHCNFKLRVDDADQDEAFVEQLAGKLGIPFYHTTFDTEAYAEKQGLSIQMAARELRYHWLEETRQSGGFAYVGTAHHLNDSIETLLYNLTQGCGIRGLHGIPPQQGAVIRPLLFAERAAIEAYAKTQGISYREDHTNAETKYRRNFLRHEVIPLLRELNPAFDRTMADNLSRFRETEYLYGQMIRRIVHEAIVEDSPRFRVNIAELMSYAPALTTVLYELLSPFGFNSTQAQDVAQALQPPSTGKQFYSSTHEMLIDRDEIIVIERREEVRKTHYEISASVAEVELPAARLRLRKQEGQPDTFSADPTIAQLDAGVLQFPLTLRRWQEGDRFQPLGMGGQHQKLKDFFNNHKVNRFEKAAAWVLEDNSGRIAWLVGYRISHAFRLLPDSKAHWVLNYEVQ